MALQKEIILDNGIVLNYHRVVSINKITNLKNDIEVASYINAEQREKEKNYQVLILIVNRIRTPLQRQHQRKRISLLI